MRDAASIDRTEARTEVRAQTGSSQYLRCRQERRHGSQESVRHVGLSRLSRRLAATKPHKAPLLQSRTMLKLENCRERQTRLLKLMESRQFDLAILSNPKTIYYFSGALIPPQAPHAFLLTSSGKSVLITHAPIGESPVPRSPSPTRRNFTTGTASKIIPRQRPGTKTSPPACAMLPKSSGREAERLASSSSRPATAWERP